jgi:transcriptional regulator with XRE-family HTH domain
MPKVLQPEIKQAIKASPLSQSETARQLGVSRMYVNAIINNRPIKRTHPKQNRCPITGYRI